MMMSRGGAKVASSLMAAAGPRLFSTASTISAMSREASHLLKPTVASSAADLASASGWIWTRAPAIGGVRFASTVTLGEKTPTQETTETNPKKSENESAGGDAGGNKEEKGIDSYWGVEPNKITKEDGTEWKWNCFRPWETYKADLTIDLKKHHVPTTFLDRLAYWTVKSLRWPTDLFFQRRYGCRAMMLETVAAVPGMVGGMLLHCKSLRRFEQSGGWIKALLEEAENERMHLMTFMEVAKPKWYERALVITVQGVFFNAYFFGYIISPKFAHRMVGYLEEEAIHSYVRDSVKTEPITEQEDGTRDKAEYERNKEEQSPISNITQEEKVAGPIQMNTPTDILNQHKWTKEEKDSRTTTLTDYNHCSNDKIASCHSMTGEAPLYMTKQMYIS